MAVQGIEAIKVFSEQIQEPKMNSMDRYRNEWNLITASLENFDAIRDLAFNGDLKISKFRSIYWALLLRVLNADHTTWEQQRLQQRNRYEKLKHEFVKNPHDEKSSNDDPLSQSKQSIWNQYFSDQELFAVIKQDVIRTFPGVEFFRKPLIQTAMNNILFYYAREHPYMCYRQGMHEILAPILFVMYGDHQALLHFMDLTDNIDGLLRDVLNPDYLEADSYSIFSRLMASIESYYRITNLIQTEGGYFAVENDQDIIDPVTTEVEVISQLNFIRDKILAKEDLHLHNYLLKLDIPLHIFGIRWLRLLFGREFPLLDLLMLWDAIFADSDRFDLPHYILVAMLIRIRDKLLMNDYTTCLTYLMRYPNNVDINLILRHALHMQNPKKFDRPANAFIYFTMNTESSQAPSSQNPSVSQKFIPGSAPTVRRNLPKSTTSQLQKDKPTASEKRQRSSSLSNDTIARLQGTTESDKVIIDGYSENSPELLRLELKNAQTIITISRNKLQNYLETIKKHTTTKPSEELGKALDGIEELCSLLDAKFVFPYNSRTTQIDQALEADESRQFKSMSPAAPSPATQTRRERKNTVPMTNGNNSRNDFKEFEEIEIVSNGAATAYEKPDTGFMVNSFRFLGNRREVELIPIATDERAVAAVDQLNSLSGVPSIDPCGCRDE